MSTAMRTIFFLVNFKVFFILNGMTTMSTILTPYY